jgi:hypothetical protein
MLAIYLHQLQEYFTSLRVHMGLVVVLAFFAVNGLTSAWRMEQLADQEQRYNADAAKAFDVERFDESASRWYRVRNAPTGTEFIAEGGFKWMWGEYNFTPENGVPWYWYIGRDVNFWMSRFENIDWLLIARVVLSFLCVVLAYDAISGEVERGTLRQIFLNPLSRARLLTAKYLAGFTVIMMATLLGVVVSMLLLSLNGVLQVNGNHAVRGGLLSAGYGPLCQSLSVRLPRRVQSGGQLGLLPCGPHPPVGVLRCHRTADVVPGGDEHRRTGGLSRALG